MQLITMTAISAAVIFTALTTHSLLAANETNQQKQELELLQRSIEQGLRNIVPSTAIMAFYSKECPTGWLPADGQNKTPDLRGEFIRGLDRGRGVDKFYELDKDLKATSKERLLGSWQAPTLITTTPGVNMLLQAVVGNGNDAVSPDDFSSGLQADFIRNKWYSNALRAGQFGEHLAENPVPQGRRERGNLADDVEGIPLLLNGQPYSAANARFGGTRPRNIALLYCMKE